MTRWLLAGLASLALIATGLVHGFWTDRWSASVDLRQRGDRLHSVPMAFGDWEGKEIEAKPGQVAPGVTGCIQRRYFNRRLGVEVVLALVNGRPGPVATHTPEVCYGASGYVVGQRVLAQVPLDTEGTSAQFWKADAERKSATVTTKLRIFWAWNGSQGWQAPADARRAFPRFRHPVLHKLYVLRDVSAESDAGKPAGQDEPCQLFLQELLPVLERVLFTRDG
jgi:hypothetical protein